MQAGAARCLVREMARKGDGVGNVGENDGDGSVGVCLLTQTLCLFLKTP